MNSLQVEKQPFQAGEKVTPHINFKRYYPELKEQVTVKNCEKGFCQSGWLVTVEELSNTSLGKQEYDSSWFFKIKK